MIGARSTRENRGDGLRSTHSPQHAGGQRRERNSTWGAALASQRWRLIEASVDGGAYKNTQSLQQARIPSRERRTEPYSTTPTTTALASRGHAPRPRAKGARTHKQRPNQATSASPGRRQSARRTSAHTQRAAHRKDGGGKGALPAARRLRALCSPAARQSRAVSRIGSRGSRGHAVRECHSRARGRGPRHGDGMGRKEWAGAIGAAAPASEPSISAAGKILDRRARATARLTSVEQPQAALPVGHLAHGCNVLLDELTDVPWQVQLQCRRGVLSHHQTCERGGEE